jgi:hypothetical protein
MTSLKKTLGLLGILLATAAPSAHADLLLYFSNAGAFVGTSANAPAGPGTNIYATASFVDAGADTVRLTMNVLSGAGLAAGTFVNDWYFNLAGGNSLGLSYALVGSSIGAVSIDKTAGVDCCKANGTGGNFDLAFHFNTGQPANQLGAGQSSVYDLSRTGLTSSMFNLVSQNVAGGGAGYTAAVHVQGYGNSVWLGNVPPPPPPCTVNCGTPPQELPEPGTLMILGTGLLALAYRRRKQA